MQTEAAANPVSQDAGSDSVQPSDELDNSNDLDFWEPGDDEPQAKPEPASTETDSNSETDAAQDQSQEAEEPQTTQDDDKPDDAAKAEPDDSIVVAMPDGEKLEIKELKSGYMRDRDYRQKTTAVANQRRELEALSTRVSETATAISDILMQSVPAAPDQSLISTDPLLYMQQKAQHDAAMERVYSVVDKATSAKTVVNTLTQEQQTEHNRAEIAKLAEAFPQINSQDGKTKFFDAALGAARNLGFSDQELGAVTDHRMFKVAYYADLGMKAEAAAKKAATKVQNVPPVVAQRRQAGPTATKVRANQDAMRKLGQSGSLNDAMAIDFD